MASLAELGLSSNLDISSRETFEDTVPVVAVHYDFSGIHTRWERCASVYGIDPETELPQDEFVHLENPIAGVPSFKNPTYRSLNPPFTTKYPYTLTARADHTVLVDDPVEARIGSRAELSLMIESARGEYRLPTYMVVGKEAVGLFLTSALGTLDIKGDCPMGEDEYGQFLIDDDMLASRLIQLADLSDVDIKSQIPPNHVDRALHEMVTTTLTDKYFWLCVEENIGGLGGAWQSGCMNFARAYGVKPGEIADLAMMLDDTIRPKAERLKNNKRSFPPLNYQAAEKMAQYLVSGTS